MQSLTGVFLQILHMSITATYVALTVIIFQALFLRNMPKIYSYCLWSVLLFRLLSPVSFSSPFSFASLFNPILHTGTGNTPWFISPGTQGNLPPLAPIYSPENVVAVPVQGAAEVTRVAAELTGMSLLDTITAIAAVVWAAGMLALLFYGIVTYVKVIYRVNTATLLDSPIVGEIKEIIGLRRKVQVFVSRHIGSPFVCGFIRPRIYLPLGSHGKDLTFILAHEMVHIKRLDYLVKPFACLVLVLHWFNPIVWLSSTTAI